MILKIGSNGKNVEILQDALGLRADGDFGPNTDAAVRAYQKKHGLAIDGIVGSQTWDHMGLGTTDNSELMYTTGSGLLIHRNYLPKGEYKVGPTNKEYLFLHHTAGWHNPYNTIRDWGNDTRGTICTEFVLGGPSVKGNNSEFDGVMVQAFPEGGYGWHLGQNGSQYMHTNSVGVEVCNFGYLYERDGKYYTYVAKYNGEWRSDYSKYQVAPSQVADLGQKFRGHQFWHRYSDAQIESMRKFIMFIAKRDSIDIRAGLPAWIRKDGVKAFDFKEDAYYGKVKGLLTHVNVRKDKFDLFPQQELMDMLVSL